MTAKSSLNKMSMKATLHCLAGCSIGEVGGMVLGTALGWSNLLTIIISIILAFFSGYLLTAWSLVRSDMDLKAAFKIALAADTISIAVMEVIDNAVMLILLGAMDTGITDLFFWISMLVSLALAGLVAFPINRFLIRNNRGHALAHTKHAHNDEHHDGLHDHHDHTGESCCSIA